MVREAGGFVGDFQGEEKYLEGRQIIAATPKIYPALLNLAN